MALILLHSTCLPWQVHPLDTWNTKDERNKWSVNARSFFVFVKVSLLFELRCKLKMGWNVTTFYQLLGQFRNSRLEFLAPVFLSEVSYFVKMCWADSKFTKIKILSSWIIYFVPIVWFFGDLGFVEYISDDFSWSPSDWNCSPLNLWESKFGVIWNGSWSIGNDFDCSWVSFDVTFNLCNIEFSPMKSLSVVSSNCSFFNHYFQFQNIGHMQLINFLYPVSVLGNAESFWINILPNDSRQLVFAFYQTIARKSLWQNAVWHHIQCLMHRLNLLSPYKMLVAYCIVPANRRKIHMQFYWTFSIFRQVNMQTIAFNHWLLKLS